MKLRSINLVFAGLLGTAGVFSTQALADKVVIGVPNWTGAKAAANVIKHIGETYLGQEIGLSPGSNPVIFKAMDRSKGDIDVHPEVWMPNQANLVEQYSEDNGTVVVSESPYKAFQGICVTQLAYDKGVKSIYDLVNPENAKIFDSNGDGKGELFVGAPGWASTNIETVRAIGYGYSEFFELLTIEEETNIARMKKLTEKGIGGVMSCYAPHHMFQTLGLQPLDEPEHMPDQWVMLQPTDDPDWLKKSSISTSWAPTTVHIAYSKSLQQRAPEFAKLLSSISLDTDTMNAWITEIAVGGKDPAQYAQEWIAANEDRVKSWLGI